jgi:hypothetical protein
MNDIQTALLAVVVSILGGYLALRELLAFGIREYFRAKQAHLVSMIRMGSRQGPETGEPL